MMAAGHDRRMALTFEDADVVVIGGTSGIGLATAAMAQEAGARVTVVGPRRGSARGRARTARWRALAGRRSTSPTKVRCRTLFGSFEHVDHVAMLAGTHADGEIATIDTATAREPVENRLWGALYVCKHAAPKMTDGSITICTGAGVARPRRGGGDRRRRRRRLRDARPRRRSRDRADPREHHPPGHRRHPVAHPHGR